MSAIHEERLRRRLQERRRVHRRELEEELPRLVEELKAIRVERVILFGSVVRRTIGLTSDLDLLVIWDTPMGFLERTAFLYRRLNPRVPVDLFVYTPEEIRRLADHPFIRQALAEGETVYAAGSEGGGPPLA